MQRRQEKGEGSKPPEFDIPFMFAFRVLYNIGVIYLLVGSIQVHNIDHFRKVLYIYIIFHILKKN